MVTTLTLPISKNRFVAEAVEVRLRAELGVEVDIHFNPRACGIEVDRLPDAVDAAVLLREAGLGLELAEAALLYRVDGRDHGVVYVRTARARDFGATAAELAVFHTLLEEALGLWVQASDFAQAELHVLAPAAVAMNDVRPTMVPVAAIEGRRLLELAPGYPVCPDAEEALLALERAVWGEVAGAQAAAA